MRLLYPTTFQDLDLKTAPAPTWIEEVNAEVIQHH